MNIYDTATLNRVVRTLTPPPPNFFLSMFPEIVEHQTEEIYFDVASSKPRLSPFVHPLLEGKLVETPGFATKSVKPAYIKDKRIHNPEKALKRRAGEAIGGTLTPAQRLSARLVEDLSDQNVMLDRRLEVMAAEAVIFGRQTITGDGFNGIVVDFGRDPSLNVALVGDAKWDAATSPDIGDQFETWDGMLQSKSGYSTSAVVMDTKAWALFRRNEKLMKLLDIRRGAETLSVSLLPMLSVEGVKYKGMYGEYPLFVYSHEYVDPHDNQTKNAMPDNTVVFVSRNSLEGVQHFGIIMDVEANVEAMKSFTKSWVVKDPSARILLMQSAPLMVPYRPNASMRITVA